MTSKSKKKKKSLVISDPIPCNTAFPADHVSVHAMNENGKDAVPPAPVQESQSEDTSTPAEGSVSSKDVNSSDSDLGSSGTNTPKRQSVSDNDGCDRSARSQSPEEELDAEQVEAVADTEVEPATNQSDDPDVVVLKTEAASQEVSDPSESGETDALQSTEQESVSAPPPEEDAKAKPPPVPAPRAPSRSTSQQVLSASLDKETEETPVTQEMDDSADDSTPSSPPGFLYKVNITLTPFCRSDANQNKLYILLTLNRLLQFASWKKRSGFKGSQVITKVNLYN